MVTIPYHKDQIVFIFPIRIIPAPIAANKKAATLVTAFKKLLLLAYAPKRSATLFQFTTFQNAAK